MYLHPVDMVDTLAND